MMDDIETEKISVMVNNQREIASGVVSCLTSNIFPLSSSWTQEINLMTYIRLRLARSAIEDSLNIVQKELRAKDLKIAEDIINQVLANTKNIKENFFPGGFATEEVNKGDGEEEDEK